MDGFPAGLELDLAAVQTALDRRKPGQSAITTQRKEKDQVVFHSGLIDGVTTGMPIGWTIANQNVKSKDYDHLKETYRPSHADFTYQEKYGIRDYKGGGRSSARETANWVVAGAICQQWLSQKGIAITGFVTQVGSYLLPHEAEIKLGEIEQNSTRMPNKKAGEKAAEYIKKIRKKGDTVGGVIFCMATGVEAGLGDPIFDKLNARLAHAMFTINAVKGFEIGSGFDAPAMLGSEHNDVFEKEGTSVSTKTNFSGGIQGGISNGMPIQFRVAFKPVATLMKDQETITNKGEKTTVRGKGRHDPCVVPRAVPIVEAMTALVIADFMLSSRLNKV